MDVNYTVKKLIIKILFFSFISCYTFNTIIYASKVNVSKFLNPQINLYSINKFNTELSSKSKPSIDLNNIDADNVQNYLAKREGFNTGEKIAFLTFDDGPSTTITPKILKILDDYNIKATFFVCGNRIDYPEEAKEVLLSEYNNGHSIGNHTYNHNFKKLYPNRYINTKYFIEDLSKNDDCLKDTLGENFNTRIVRFPGGHNTWKGSTKVDKILNENGYKYIDWNISIDDSIGGTKTKTQLFNTYKKEFKNQEKIIILMHDTYGKESTVKVLPEIIKDLQNKGYEFKALR